MACAPEELEDAKAQADNATEALIKIKERGALLPKFLTTSLERCLVVESAGC